MRRSEGLRANEVDWSVDYVLCFSIYFDKFILSSLPRIFVCTLTLQMVMIWWECFYFVYNLGYKEFVGVVTWGGGIYMVIEE